MNDILDAHKEKHEFALHVESLSLLTHNKGPGDTITIADEKLLHRIMTVLRLHVGQTCTFFDQKIVATMQLAAFIGKKQIQVIITSMQPTTTLQPKITFLLPMLKRDDYEATLYALSEVGVNNIQLVFTQKTSTSWSPDRDKDRAQRIIIAAAEQSKNFAYPNLLSPISLQAALQQYNTTAVKIFFDPQGESLFNLIKTVHNNQPKELLLLIGPEGDLSLEEKKMVLAKNFIFYALTPTIMRAVQAATVAAGVIRSILR